MGKYILHGKTLAEWSAITGLAVRFIRLRMQEHYDINLILAPKRKLQVARGSIKSLVDECASDQGVGRKAIYMRLNRGWTIDEVKKGKRKI